AVEEEPQALARLRHPRAEADRSIETRSHDRPGSVVRRCRPRSPRGPRPALNRHRCPAGPTGVGRPARTNWRSFTAGERKTNAGWDGWIALRSPSPGVGVSADTGGISPG